MLLNRTIIVDDLTFQSFKNFISKKRLRRFEEGDSDSSLEIKLCQCVFNTKNVKKASLEENIKKDIDCFVDNKPVQIKCRQDSRLSLELYKYRNFRKIPGWLERNKDDTLQFVFVWWEKDVKNKLHYSIFLNQDLQRLSRICQEKFFGENNITEEDSSWIKKYFFNLDFTSFVDSQINEQSGDSLGSFFQVKYC